MIEPGMYTGPVASRASEADALREYLASRDAGCPGYGYNLRGLATDQCPECNQPLVLAVGLAEPKMRLWLAAVVGLALGTGLKLLLLVYAVIAGAMRLLLDEFGIYNGAALLVEGGLLVAALGHGRALRRWPMSWRWVLCCGAYCVTVTNISLFTWMVS